MSATRAQQSDSPEMWSLLREALMAAYLELYTPVRKGFRPRRPEELAEWRKSERAAWPFTPAQWRQAGREVLALHEAYTGGGANFTHENNPIHGYQAGYQVYFLPRNVYRIHSILEGLALDPDGAWQVWGRGGGPFRILDLGCGTGAFTIAVLAWLQRSGALAVLPPVEVTLVDQSRDLLRLAGANVQQVTARLMPEARISVISQAEGVEQFLGRAPDTSYHIAGAGFMLNELKLLASQRTEKRAVRFVEPFRRRVAAGGLMLFAEPGTRKGYMNLMMVREQLREAAMLYPCPHTKDCPMWTAKVGRWCHATVSLPHQFCFDDELKRHGGVAFAMRELNLAGLAIQNAPRPEAPFRARRGARVVSAPIPQRVRQGQPPGKPKERISKVLVCQADGRLRETPAEQVGPVPRGGWLAAGRSRK